MKIKLFSKQISAILLSLAVLASTLTFQTFSAFATETPDSETWNGQTASGFADGDGSAGNPYQISTAEELALLGKYVAENNASYNAKNYVLTQNIVLNNVSAAEWYNSSGLNEWTYGAADSDAAFMGTLDGQGYVIKGIYIKTTALFSGLFSRISAHTTIKNLGIESSYIETTNSSGTAAPFAGVVHNWADGDHIIDSCYSADTVIIKAGKAGGIIGNISLPNTSAYKVNMTNCYSSAVLDGNTLGSFIGFWYYADKLSVKQCYATQTDVPMVNGIGWGKTIPEGSFENCYTLGITPSIVGNPVDIEGITRTTAEKLKGNEAPVNMKGFKFPRLWYVRDNDFPVPTIFKHLGPDEVKPTFTGEVSTIVLSSSSAALMWPKASDDRSDPDDMIYRVYKSDSPITAVTDDMLYGSYVGLYDAEIENLEVGKTYCFAVVAVDNADNESAMLTASYTHTEWSPCDDWDGTVADGLMLGNGTLANPYKIINAEQLAYLVNLSNSENASETKNKHYSLTVDIDLKNKEWTVGTSDDISISSFYGNFDGNGHTVKGLYINADAKKYNGLFAGVTEGALIKNFGIESSYVKAGDDGYAGALAGGRSETTKKDGVLVEYCYIGNGVTTEGAYAGGFFGIVAQKTSFINCYSKADAKGKTASGTFVGDHSVAKIEVVVNGSYSTDPKLPMVALTNKKAVATYQNCYTVAASSKGLASITLEHMTGVGAKNYMSTLDFTNVWLTEENDTPSLSVFTPQVVWDGTVSEELYLKNPDEPNSAANPYLINNGADLALLASYAKTDATDKMTNKYFLITNDIILNDVSTSGWYNNSGLNEWTYGAASSGAAFTGNLDGDGHVIKGIYINTTERYAGLFSRLSYHTSITNLGIESSYIESSHSAGTAAPFVGVVNNWADGHHVFDSCYSDDTVIIKATSSAGGIIGDSSLTTTGYKVKITNCYSSAVLEGSRRGSIIGFWYYADKLSVKQCYATQTGVPMVVGMQWGKKIPSSTFSNCYTLGITPNIINNPTDIKGITRLTADQMTGINAKDVMDGFDFVDKDNQDATWYTRYGKTPHLTIFNNMEIDFDAPTFKDGDIEAVEITGISITVQWPEAVDNYTPSAFMEYSVYYSDEKITAENIADAVKLGNYGSSREATLADIGLGDKIYFAVGAIDQSGNETYMFADKYIKTERTKTNGIWSGEQARYFDFGDGSEDNPYIIANAEQMAYFESNLGEITKGKYYAIDNDILLNDVSDTNWKNNDPNEWIYGIGNEDVGVFFGNLDGRGHVIKGLYIDSEGYLAGLFAAVEGAAVIQDLGIVESSVSISNETQNCYAAAFAGRRNSMTEGDGVKFIRCFVDETVEIYAFTNTVGIRSFVGGFLGSVQHGRGNEETAAKRTTLQDCYSGGIISAQNMGLFICDNYADKDTVILERCFSIAVSNEITFDYYNIVKYIDCYSADKVDDGITRIDIINMIGKNADKYMTALDYEDVWTTTDDGTPMLRVFGNHPEYALNRLPVTVSYDTNGADPIEPSVGYVGSKLELPKITREGYAFEGWYIYANMEYPIDTYPAYDIALKAKWRDLATLRVDFESYPYTDAGEDGLGEDYELYRPGVSGYSTEYVHAGGRSMHRIGDLDTEQSFQLFDVDSTPLEVGKNYQLTMWVYADDVTSGSIQLESSDRLKISKTSTVVTTAADVTKLSKGEWLEVNVDFTARGKYLLIRTPGLTDMYFDDISIFKLPDGAEIPAPTVSDNQTTGTVIDADTDTSTDDGSEDLDADTSTDDGSEDRDDEISEETDKSNAIVICLIVFAVFALALVSIILFKRKKFLKEND